MVQWWKRWWWPAPVCEKCTHGWKHYFHSFLLAGPGLCFVKYTFLDDPELSLELPRSHQFTSEEDTAENKISADKVKMQGILFPQYMSKEILENLLLAREWIFNWVVLQQWNPILSLLRWEALYPLIRNSISILMLLGNLPFWKLPRL